MFGPSSVWRQRVGDAPLAANSGGMVTSLVQQVSAYYGGTAAFNNSQYGDSWYNARPRQATTTVRWNNCQHYAHTPPGLFGHGGQFVDVPIPNDAVQSAGTDHTLTVYRPSTDQLWDFWRVGHDSSGWNACWGGRIDHVSRSPGYFTGGFGAAATGLAGEAGAVTITDVRSGSIDHAMTLVLPSPANYPRFNWPAQRTDGSTTGPDAVPEGARLRLDPNLDVDALHLNPVGTMIAKAAQKYGFIVVNKSASVGVGAESGAPATHVTGTNPWREILGASKPFQVMAKFPWQHMQIVSSEWSRRQLR